MLSMLNIGKCWVIGVSNYIEKYLNEFILFSEIKFMVN